MSEVPITRIVETAERKDCTEILRCKSVKFVEG